MRLSENGGNILIQGAKAGCDAVPLSLAGLRTVQVGPELFLINPDHFQQAGKDEDAGAYIIRHQTDMLMVYEME